MFNHVARIGFLASPLSLAVCRVAQIWSHLAAAGKDGLPGRAVPDNWYRRVELSTVFQCLQPVYLCPLKIAAGCDRNWSDDKCQSWCCRLRELFYALSSLTQLQRLVGTLRADFVSLVCCHDDFLLLKHHLDFHPDIQGEREDCL